MLIHKSEDPEGDDKQWAAGDNSITSPYYGNVYAAWDGGGLGSSPLRFARTTNHGASWKGIKVGGIDKPAGFTLTGKCHVGAPRETITYTSSNNRGTWDVLYSECNVALGSGNPPSSGACATGTQKNDNLIGTSGNDCIDGKSGNDKISGLAGNDKLNGDDGNDLISGGTGNDELTGGKGADKFDCGAGKDKITDFKVSEGDIKTNDCEQF
jgi:Ca2+-binding RTX toxin-like protein